MREPRHSISPARPVRWPWRLPAALLLIAAGALSWAQAPSSARQVVLIELQDMIGPATADLVHRGLAAAAERRAELVVLRMDTPGGLDTSMRQIVREILEAPVPVVTFVAPEGARAASAGTYILYASHIAAMSPATNLGAATPIAIGGGRVAVEAGARRDAGSAAGADAQPREPGGTTSQDAAARKQIEDAAAWLRSLAQLRGRNVEFAESAVREGRSLSATEALAAGVIDLIAADVPDLLDQLDGRTVQIHGKARELHTQGARIETFTPDWRTRFLGLISQPTVALLLMMIGMYGLFIEFTSPGFGVPGVAGALCLLLGLYALHLLPVNWVGVALLGLGMALMISELLMPSFGALGVGGIIAFIAGGILLFDTGTGDFGLPLWLVVATALVSAAFVFLVGGMALRARSRPVVTGREALPGSYGEVLEADGTSGTARVRGEIWRVRADQPLHPGAQVTVTGIEGLTLAVRLDPGLSSPNKGDEPHAGT